MIHYHGLPITPDKVVADSMRGASFFVSAEYPDQLSIACEIGSTVSIDNGAFSRWKKGDKSKDWLAFYAWIREIAWIPKLDFVVIPDVIEGSEDENDALISQFPFPMIGAPVWHLHESIERLQRLCRTHRIVCLGSSGQYSTIGTRIWLERMNLAFSSICDSNGRPSCQIHGLRMLDPEIVTRFPFRSCDSTNIARNIGIDSRWTGSYSPPTKSARAALIRARIESAQSPCLFKPCELYQIAGELF